MADREDGWTYSYQDLDAYQDATYGYDAYSVDLGEYQFYFRAGFQRGYDDGYYGRFQYGYLYNGNYGVTDEVMDQVLDLQQM